MSWPLFFTINSIECVRGVYGQGQGGQRRLCPPEMFTCGRGEARKIAVFLYLV